ncbi:hypothetical protein D3C71_1733110 [compost metagenome]
MQVQLHDQFIKNFPSAGMEDEKVILGAMLIEGLVVQFLHHRCNIFNGVHDGLVQGKVKATVLNVVFDVVLAIRQEVRPSLGDLETRRLVIGAHDAGRYGIAE